MKKLIFFMSLALCSLFANAQQLEQNYRDSFWSNWSIGAGAVYSKPFDVQNWWLDDGANFGGEIRFEKSFSPEWTVRLVGCVPGIKNTGHYDRYGTAMAGVSLNLGRYFHLFADGGIAYAKFGTIQSKKVYLAADYGLGSHIYLSDNSKIYIEIGSDCASMFSKPNSNLFGKVGYMYNLGRTKKDDDNIAKLHQLQNGVTQSEYEKLMAQKEEYAAQLEGALKELENMRNCCNSNNSKYEKEIADLKEALANKKDSAIPFSVLFEKNSANLSKVAKEIISQVAIEINKDGGSYTLYGFGDYTGTENYNETLSQSRCESVKAELIRNGVSENKINVVGLGKTQYFGSSESYVNRRVMFVKD
jgi:outer membrane protein OmpA-like peptidoglycan-associated protein